MDSDTVTRDNANVALMLDQKIDKRIKEAVLRLLDDYDVRYALCLTLATEINTGNYDLQSAIKNAAMVAVSDKLKGL